MQDPTFFPSPPPESSWSPMNHNGQRFAADGTLSSTLSVFPAWAAFLALRGSPAYPALKVAAEEAASKADQIADGEK